jgi:AraC-like DNA-binding protein
MRVLAGGRTHIPPGVPYPPAGHPDDHALRWPRLRIIDEYQYILITCGRGYFRSEATGEVAITSPCVLLLFPGIGHSYHPDIGTGWVEYWLAFRGDIPDRLRAEGIIDHHRPIHPIGRSRTVVDQIGETLDRLAIDPHGQEGLLAAECLALLAHLRGAEQRAGDPQAAALVLRAIARLEEVDAPDVRLGALARDLGVSPAHLRRMIKDHTGLAPKNYQQAVRIARAKRLLRNPHMGVTEVAERLGFASPFHFSRLFKRLTGSPPSAWQQEDR